MRLRRHHIQLLRLGVLPALCYQGIMSRLQIHQILVLNDNYVYLARCSESGSTAVVDPAVAAPVLEEAARHGWKISHILNTHHHGDHVGGNLEIKRATGCQIIGPAYDAERIPGIDLAVREGDEGRVGGAKAEVGCVPGQTVGDAGYCGSDVDGG